MPKEIFLSTFSGSRGQKVPVSIYKIDTDYNVKPFLTELMNATAIVFDARARCLSLRDMTARFIA